MSKQSHSFYFDFSQNPIYDNDATLLNLQRSIDRGCVETIEQMFDIMFAAGCESGEPYYLTLDEEDDTLIAKYDGMVDLSNPPRDNDTGKPFKKRKLTFRIDYLFDKQGYEIGWKTYINSQFRKSSDN